MKNENDYYAPAIEDFHIGYAFEFRPWDWKNGVFLEDWKTGVYRKEKSIHKLEEKYINKGMLRVPYLCKYQIESEGYPNIGATSNGGSTIYRISATHALDFNGTNWLMKKENDPRLRLIEVKEVQLDLSFQTLYKGECKSINELRKILKWVL